MRSDFFKFRVRLWGLMAAGGAVAAAASAAGFFGRFAWWLDIGSHFRVQYAVGFAALAICYIAGKKKRWAAAALCFAVLNVIPVIAILLPPAPNYIRQNSDPSEIENRKPFLSTSHQFR